MPERILVTGRHGQLGRRLLRLLGDQAIGLGRDECDITSRRQVCEAVQHYRPTAVVNAAAYTDVDQSEVESDRCYQVNTDAVGNLAVACNLVDARLIQISTDYVFGSKPAERRTPFSEEDPVSPHGVYATSKYGGEQLAQESRKVCIVRTCGLYDVPDSEGRCKNFCNTMLNLAAKHHRLRVVDDQWCNPSYIPDVAQAINDLIHSESEGVFHVVNESPTTWFRMAQYLFQSAGLNVVLEAISSSQYPVKIERPSYSALATDRFFGQCGYRLRPWHDAIDAYLAQRTGGNAASQRIYV